MILLQLVVSITATAKNINSINSSDIKSVQLYKNGWVLSQPIINLGSTDQLLLSFDDLAGNSDTYNYTVIHCTPEWEESGLSPVEYIDGFAVNQILSYKPSYSTTYRYVHYELLLPNSDLSFKLSGNYILKVTKAGEDKPVLTRQFYIADNKIGITPIIKTPFSGSNNDTHQEINFTINYSNFKINNPREDIQVVIQQNGRQDNMVTNIKPQFIRPNELVYNYSKETTFAGCNEFRWIDIRSLRLLSERTLKIDFFDPFYHVTLTPDVTRIYATYFYHQDFNGHYVLNVKEGRDPALEGDYAFVHLTLPLDAPFINASVHAIGDGFGWRPSAENVFQYNFDNHCYEFTALLKQGIYDYLIGVQEKGASEIDFERFEGSYRETENQYTIYVYFKSFGDNYWQLIGIEYANTLHK